MENIHATSVDIDDAGILITGESCVGKSDLALRLIENKGAVLVADDRTILSTEGKNLIASCPENIKGLMEARGIGIINKPCKPQTIVRLVVSFEINPERYPKQSFYETQGLRVPRIFLNFFEASAPDKVVIKLKTILEEMRQRI